MKENKKERNEEKSTKMSSPAGNRTPVSRVTGGDTDHYTTEDLGNGRLLTLVPNRASAGHTARHRQRYRRDIALSNWTFSSNDTRRLH